MWTQSLFALVAGVLLATPALSADFCIVPRALAFDHLRVPGSPGEGVILEMRASNLFDPTRRKLSRYGGEGYLLQLDSSGSVALEDPFTVESTFGSQVQASVIVLPSYLNAETLDQIGGIVSKLLNAASDHVFESMPIVSAISSAAIEPLTRLALDALNGGTVSSTPLTNVQWITAIPELSGDGFTVSATPVCPKPILR